METAHEIARDEFNRKYAKYSNVGGANAGREDEKAGTSVRTTFHVHSILLADHLHALDVEEHVR